MSEASLADASAAIFTLEINGQTWTFSPPTLGDLGHLERWAKAQIMRDLQREFQENPAFYADSKNREIAQRQSREWARQIRAEGIGDRNSLIMEYLATEQGLKIFARSFLIKNHPNITEDEVTAIMKQTNGFQDVLDFFKGDEGEGEGEGEGEKKAPVIMNP